MPGAAGSAKQPLSDGYPDEGRNICIASPCRPDDSAGDNDGGNRSGDRGCDRRSSVSDVDDDRDGDYAENYECNQFCCFALGMYVRM